MKKTTFNGIHKKLGAKLVEFAGYEMPIQYSSIIAEHKAVRNSVGVFDVSHMALGYLIRVRGRVDLIAGYREGKIKDQQGCQFLSGMLFFSWG